MTTQNSVSTAYPLATSLTRRLAFSVIIALLAGCYCWLDAAYIRPSIPHRDFDSVWLAARLLIGHRNPYALIGPGGQYEWGFPFFYPLTAAVAVLPLAWLPFFAARIIFSGISAGAFAYVVGKDSWARWPVFLSACMLESASSGQWTALLIAASFTPWAGGLLAAKPNLAAVLLLARPNKRQWIGTAIGACFVAIVAFVLKPNWLLSWYLNVQQYGDPPLVRMLPLGPIIVLALFRWRRWESRLLLLQGIVTRSVTGYAELPLFLIPETTREAFVLCIGSYLAAMAQGYAIQPNVPYDLRLADSGYLLFMYAPALVMIWKRPNE